MIKYSKDNVAKVLNELHLDARGDYMRIGKGVVKSIFRPMKPADFEHAYLPISRQQGEDLRQMIIKHDCKNVVEFGASFGISTIYLADAVRETGGKLISTELLESKANRALENISNAGLSNYVDLRIGDAMETLKDYAEPIDFLFLDGWKDLYLPLFKMLESRFHQGTLIYADNMDMSGTQYFGDYVSAAKQSYSSHFVHDGKAMLTACAA